MSGRQQVDSKSRGIVSVTRGPADLVVPPNVPEPGLMCRYGVAFPFQIAPRQAALSCSLRNENLPGGDFENGADIILFDDLSRISADGAVPITRNDKYVNEQTGQPRIVIRYPVVGGFVPLGARRADGSPHPHAGTGFGLCEALDFPMYEGCYYKKEDKRKSMVRIVEVRQFAYDGKQFRITATEAYDAERKLTAPGSDWALVWPGLRQAVADGDDLLYPVLATTGDPRAWRDGAMASGVARWTRQDGAWRPTAFRPVIVCDSPLADVWLEPSLVRDTDGALLFTARGCADPGLDKSAPVEVNHVVRVWRSTDDGQSWQPIIDQPQARGQAPITLNQAVDGTPYIVASALGRERDLLNIWPLSDDRTGLESPILVRDALGEFGPPPSGIVWFMDHANAGVVQLADGKWHDVLSYRIMDRGEHRGDDPAEPTGQYIEEVISTGPPVAPWRFD